MTDYRAHFDARVSFANGGGLEAEGFRLDLPSASLTSDAVGQLFVRHLGLALVAEVVLANFQIVEEQHRGSRGIAVEPSATPGSHRRVIDLTHLAEARLTTVADLASHELETLVGLPAEVFHLADVGARGIPASIFLDRELAGTAVLLNTGWGGNGARHESDAGFLTMDGARYLADAGVAAVGIDAPRLDDVVSGARPASSVLQEAGIHVIEHLTQLAGVPARGARFSVVPLGVLEITAKHAAPNAVPVRAFAEVSA